MFSKEEAKEKIKKLVEEFDRNLPVILADKQKNESQIEDRYIKPFFSYLNWNTSNIGLDYGKEEFVVQPHLKIADSTVRPDYLLKLPTEVGRMKRHLFIEAKHPAYNLKSNVKYIRQVYQYAHSTLSATDLSQNRCPLAILTDFEEFRLFDCSDNAPLLRPNIDNLAVFNKHIIKPFDLSYKDYVEKFDLIWDLLERNNVANGSLAKWELSDKQLKENRVAPDLKFLDDLKMWRLELARSMYPKNNELDDFTISQATLMFINRIIFIKMLADRGIEVDYLTDILNEITNSKKKDIKLFELCKNIFDKINKAYNGSIFEYKKEFDEIEIENRVLIKIFEALKPDTSVYTLAAMPVEIIGYVYEYFISEQIIKRKNKIELVPKYEDKKAAGVYYTPRYIVEYIVENTLGVKLRNLEKVTDIFYLSVIDPACGSGSFLIVAYQKIIDYVAFTYKKQIEQFKANKDLIEEFNRTSSKLLFYEIKENNEIIVHLSPLLKNAILKRCIYGVDIDFQAVQVTKFSLYIKLLEDTAYIEKYKQELFSENQLLPNLDNNIKCGNSLIESDFYLDNRPSLFNEKEKRKINTFDWSSENGFPEIMKNGGFDVVIGNPPYVNIVNVPEAQREYLKRKYTITKNKVDLYAYFIEFIIKKLMKKDSLLGYIVSNSWLAIDSFQPLRNVIFSNGTISLLCKMPNGTFKDAQVETVIMIYNKDLKNNIINVSNYENQNFSQSNCLFINEIKKDKNLIIMIDSKQDEVSLLNKLELNSKLGQYLHFSRGVKTSNDTKFVLENKENKDCYKLLRGKNIQKYYIDYKNLWLWYRPDLMKEKYGCLTHTKDAFFVEEKIIIQGRSGKKLIATYDDEKYFVLDTAYFSKSIDLQAHSIKYFLALMNSKLLNYWYSSKFKTPTISGYELHQLPTKSIDFTKPEEKQKHDKLVKLVEQMLENQKYLHTAPNESDIQIYRNICTKLDQQIDSLVYQLYGLTEEEIRIVEGE